MIFAAAHKERSAAISIPGGQAVERAYFLHLCLSVSILPLGASQTALSPSAHFRGVVVDSESTRIPKASVTIEGADQRLVLKTGEDEKATGEINIELPAGRYRFTVEAPGFKRLIVTDFCIAAGAKPSFEFRMEVGACNDCDGLAVPAESKPVSPSAPPNNPQDRTQIFMNPGF
jgi:hypothetical protein